MCGISGIISKLNNPIEQGEIEKITDLIKHRGPDGVGYFSGKNFSFGHRRLSIIDLSDHGHQPMSYLDRYWITYNGEIYNYLEIRSELVELGYLFNSNTDTEVILAAYDHWGAKCLERFNGMWAFAIYDSKEQNIFLSRDRFGVKPLYYLDINDQFAFGSEIKQLLSLQKTVHSNHKVVIEYLLTSMEGHNDDTFFDGIKSFPQSHYGIYDLRKHTLVIERYYKLKVDSSLQNLSIEEAVSRFRILFEDSVKIRLRSDVRVGTCLSGGLDSSSTSAVASGLYHANGNGQFIGIHAKSSDVENDESNYSKISANHSGIDLHIVEPDIENFMDIIDEVVYTQEEPFGSPSQVMGWYVFNEAKSLGCKVMLNGQGGDEVLLGYERYFSSFLKSTSLMQFPKVIKELATNSKLSIKDLFLYYFYFSNSSFRIKILKKHSMLRSQYKEAHDFDAVRKSVKSFKSIEELQNHEISTLQLPHLLRYEDRNSMRHSVETRLPFLDYRLVEFCVSIAVDSKIRQGWSKYILRESMDDILPKSIAWRKDKMGFEAPTRTWIGGCSEQMKQRVIESNLLKKFVEHGNLVNCWDGLSLSEKWKYYSIAAWERKFNVVS